jgi:hypothetical protein
VKSLAAFAFPLPYAGLSLSAEGNLKTSLAMIEWLPLTDKEKADAVRQLLAAQKSWS